MLIPRLKNNGKVTLWLNPLQLKVKKQIQDKMNSGIYEFESHQECVVCKSSSWELIGERDRYGLYYPVNICQKCGFVFVNPRIDQKSYNQFYSTEYRKLYLGAEKPTDYFFQQQYKQGERIYNFLAENNMLGSSHKSVLEVGCGAGGILLYFKEKGFEVKGIDLCEEYIEYGKNSYNLDLYTTNLKGLKLFEKPDIIIYSHVLEHLLNLEEELALIKSICKPHTKVYIEVPSLKRMHKVYDYNILKYFHIAHTYHFTLATLKNLLTKNGFDLVVGNEQVMSVFQPAESTSKSITNDYDSAIAYIEKYEKLRWVYYLLPRAIKYYSGMIVIKALDRLGWKEKVKGILGR